ncbi:hypothetical protein GCM10017562_10350 [Streptomyces roseofulvus]
MRDEGGEEVPVAGVHGGEAEPLHVEPAIRVRVRRGESKCRTFTKAPPSCVSVPTMGPSLGKPGKPSLPSSNHHTPNLLQLVA